MQVRKLVFQRGTDVVSSRVSAETREFPESLALEGLFEHESVDNLIAQAGHLGIE